jgi:hypothetical protein
MYYKGSDGRMQAWSTKTARRRKKEPILPENGETRTFSIKSFQRKFVKSEKNCCLFTAIVLILGG